MPSLLFLLSNNFITYDSDKNSFTERSWKYLQYRDMNPKKVEESYHDLD